MRSQFKNRWRGHLDLALKCASVLLLFLISALIVACGANNNAQAPGNPPVTVTINLDKSFSSPTAKIPDYSCGAWATQSTPAYTPNGLVEVYGKFVHNVDGNPQGMDQANATAIVRWPDGHTTSQTVRTSKDGLAVFSIQMEPIAINHVTLVEVDFQSADGQQKCNVTDDRMAFFTAIQVSPTAIPSPSPSATPTTPGGQETATPTIPGFPGPGKGKTPTPTDPALP